MRVSPERIPVGTLNLGMVGGTPIRCRAADLDGNSHEGPAFGADVALLPTASDVVVVCQIDIEHELSFHWGKAACARHKCPRVHAGH